MRRRVRHGMCIEIEREREIENNAIATNFRPSLLECISSCCVAHIQNNFKFYAYDMQTFENLLISKLNHSSLQQSSLIYASKIQLLSSILLVICNRFRLHVLFLFPIYLYSYNELEASVNFNKNFRLTRLGFFVYLFEIT